MIWVNEPQAQSYICERSRNESLNKNKEEVKEQQKMDYYKFWRATKSPVVVVARETNSPG